MTNPNQVTVYLKPAVRELLRELARRGKISQSEILSTAILHWAKVARLPGADLANIADPDDAPDRRDPIAESDDARG